MSAMSDVSLVSNGCERADWSISERRPSPLLPFANRPMHRQVTAVAPLHPFANGGSAEASMSVRPRLGNVEKAQARDVNSQDAKDRARGS